MNTFQETLSFTDKMRKPAHKIIAKAFGIGFQSITRVQSLRDLALDQRAGIDSLVIFEPSKVNYTLQEKYRTFDKLKFKDFTQELYNAYQTEYQSDGEFLHLHATYYFYGWCNEAETDFAEWFIMNIAVYKQLVLQAGGLAKIPGAKAIQNNAYGKALFYSMPLEFLKPAIEDNSQGLDEKFK